MSIPHLTDEEADMLWQRMQLSGQPWDPSMADLEAWREEQLLRDMLPSPAERARAQEEAAFQKSLDERWAAEQALAEETRRLAEEAADALVAEEDEARAAVQELACRLVDQDAQAHDEAEAEEAARDLAVEEAARDLAVEAELVAQRLADDQSEGWLVSDQPTSVIVLESDSEDAEAPAIEQLEAQLRRSLHLTSLVLPALKLGAVPEPVWSMSGLTELCLVGMQLQRLPEAVVFLSLLEILDVSENELRTLPESLPGLHHLAELHARQNQLSAAPRALDTMHALRYLDLSFNQITHGPETAGCGLVVINLNGNPLVDMPRIHGPRNLAAVFVSEDICVPHWVRALSGWSSGIWQCPDWPKPLAPPPTPEPRIEEPPKAKSRKADPDWTEGGKAKRGRPAPRADTDHTCGKVFLPSFAGVPPRFKGYFRTRAACYLLIADSLGLAELGGLLSCTQCLENWKTQHDVEVLATLLLKRELFCDYKSGSIMADCARNYPIFFAQLERAGALVPGSTITTTITPARAGPGTTLPQRLLHFKHFAALHQYEIFFQHQTGRQLRLRAEDLELLKGENQRVRCVPFGEAMQLLDRVFAGIEPPHPRSFAPTDTALHLEFYWYCHATTDVLAANRLLAETDPRDVALFMGKAAMDELFELHADGLRLRRSVPLPPDAHTCKWHYGKTERYFAFHPAHEHAQTFYLAIGSLDFEDFATALACPGCLASAASLGPLHHLATVFFNGEFFYDASARGADLAESRAKHRIVFDRLAQAGAISFDQPVTMLCSDVALCAVAQPIHWHLASLKICLPLELYAAHHAKVFDAPLQLDGDAFLVSSTCKQYPLSCRASAALAVTLCDPSQVTLPPIGVVCREWKGFDLLFGLSIIAKRDARGLEHAVAHLDDAQFRNLQNRLFGNQDLFFEKVPAGWWSFRISPSLLNVQ